MAKIKTSYTTIYNMRPEEMFGMGKESLICTGVIEEEELNDFFKRVAENSCIKHDSILEYAYGSEECWEREDWKPYVGQPMFYVVDIKWEYV